MSDEYDDDLDPDPDDERCGTCADCQMCANQPEVTLLPQRVLRLDYPAKPNAHTATADLIAMAMAHLMDGEVYAVLSTEWGYLPEGGWYVLATVADPPEEMLTEEAMRTLGVTPFLN